MDEVKLQFSENSPNTGRLTGWNSTIESTEEDDKSKGKPHFIKQFISQVCKLLDSNKILHIKVLFVMNTSSNQGNIFPKDKKDIKPHPMFNDSDVEKFPNLEHITWNSIGTDKIYFESDISSETIKEINQNLVEDKITQSILSDEQHLQNILSKLYTTNTIDPELINRLSSLKETSLGRYIFDILKIYAHQYPWLENAPSVNEVKRKIELYGDNYIINLKILVKNIYVITKLIIRNSNMLRLPEIDPSYLGSLEGLEHQLYQLLFTPVSEEFVPGLYDDMKNYEYATPMKSLLGSSYETFIDHILDDGSEHKTKIVRTETLLKYIIIALSNFTNISVETESEYRSFFKSVTNLLIDILIKNEQLVKLDEIVSRTIGDKIQYLHNSKNNLYTFVRINSKDPERTNIRYNISLDASQQIMMVGYNSIPEKMYVDGNLLPKFQHLTTEEYVYPDNYLFGPFSYVFTPFDDNYQISNHSSMEPLLKSLKNKKSVCIIGYGASGSGKTTTLIYAGYENEDQKKNGVLINFCNKLTGQYKFIELSFVELEGDITQRDEYEASKKYKVIPETDSDINYLYYKPHSFILSQNSSWVLEDEAKEFPKSTPLGDFIVNVMDSRRDIKATTNNPVSSRSHIIIFIKLKGTRDDQSGPYLIICDFAGVENKFECNSNEVLQKFLDIKSKTECVHPTDLPGKCVGGYKGFYDDYIDNQLHVLTQQAKQDIPIITKTLKSQGKLPLGVTEEFLQKYINNNIYSKKEELARDEQMLNAIRPPKTNKIGLDVFDLEIDRLSQLKREYLPHIQKEKIVQSKTSKSSKVDVIKPLLWNLNNFIDRPLIKRGRDEIRDPNSKYIPIINIWFDSKLLKPPASGGSDIEFQRFINKNLGDTEEKYKETLQNIKQYVHILYELQYVKDTKEEAIKELGSKKMEVAKFICEDRVKEGQFINDSLDELRSFISYFITELQSQSSKTKSPKFVDICLPMQCNPYYEDCFGSTTKKAGRQEPKSVIMNQFRKKIMWRRIN